MPTTLTSLQQLVLGALSAAALAFVLTGDGRARAAVQDGQGPSFRIDESWPAPLPNDWILGGPASVAVDRHDHVWILHRPAMAPAEAVKSGKRIAPPVLELDPTGKVLQAWGGAAAGYDWPQENLGDYPRGSPGEHGIFVDGNDNVWIAGNGDVVLKFSKTGKFLLQIGEKFRTGGSNDPRLLGNPTDVAVDIAAAEVYVSDGYLNRRVVVFDAETGRYKRHWGAYGNKPDDGVPANYERAKPPPSQFFIVHCVRLSNDGLVYVCDRQRNRVQVFRKDGTFVAEAIVAPDTPTGAGITLKGPLASGVLKAGIGSVYRVGFSPDAAQQHLYVADATNSKIWIFGRRDLQPRGSFDARGLHHLAGADSKGNLYASGGTLPVKFVPAAARQAK